MLGRMDLAYVDESGTPGYGGSQTFALGCVVVSAISWPDVFDDLIDFRRWLKASFGVPVRAEIKANYLLRNGGPLRPLALPESVRFTIYRQFMRLMPKLELRVFAVVAMKADLSARGVLIDPRDIAWDYLFQRLERMSTKSGVPVMLVHDEGESRLIRKFARKARRAGSAGAHFGTGVLRRPARLLIDDPVPRQSHQSYLLQAADLAAYAAFRHLYPPPGGHAPIVTQKTWEELGAARYDKVNSLAGGPSGIVVAK